MTSDSTTGHPTPQPHGTRQSLWRKLGGGSLSISLIVHAILLCLGVFWIFQIMPEEKTDVDFMPKGGGGGSPGVKEISNKKQRATMSVPNAPRMVAKGATSNFTLPEADPSSAMSSVGAPGGGSLSGGLGGSGSGGGRGDGNGKGFGSGKGPGLGGGAGTMNPFGMLDPNANALVGTFYDLKQNPKGRPSELGEKTNWDQIISGTREVVHHFVSRGWNERTLASTYYQAPQKVYQTKVFIPSMDAGSAPKAFNCNVPGSRWMVVYRGMVRPPHSGKFRFVGAGDDILAVRFNRRNVFDYGYESATGGFQIFSNMANLQEPEKAREFARKERGFSMPLPLQTYGYPGLSSHARQYIKGLGVGETFEARDNTDYPIEILISEVPGGFFFAYLLIEEVGANPAKTPEGLPVLPLFRLDGSEPAAGSAGPPFDKQAAPWRISRGSQVDI
ncbi:hypothetical protein KBB96_11230 [Luteolibacter ambystomatis]|uniref:PA14 domain-containing protein n=1 Tax=Luteolibacter ambystomatis TaxID=2824561 RepID=A0A975G5Z4_9BACT|nr:hypothetical protein [Luteolibacter ambystomatis]QUE49445.1 hypothetical protein KBB96_11230 [Luteolibacter ambystomatis]